MRSGQRNERFILYYVYYIIHTVRFFGERLFRLEATFDSRPHSVTEALIESHSCLARLKRLRVSGKTISSFYNFYAYSGNFFFSQNKL